MGHTLYELHMFLAELPGGVIVAALAVALVAALTARRRVSQIVLWAGIAIFAAPFVLLLSAATGWAGDNPVGLGLLALLFGQPLSLIVIVVGLLLRLWEFVRPI